MSRPLCPLCTPLELPRWPLWSDWLIIWDQCGRPHPPQPSCLALQVEWLSCVGTIGGAPVGSCVGGAAAALQHRAEMHGRFAAALEIPRQPNARATVRWGPVPEQILLNQPTLSLGSAS
jgi:hypothetical protein